MAVNFTFVSGAIKGEDGGKWPWGLNQCNGASGPVRVEIDLDC